ncbi:hypothetical protein GGI11_003986 [Coemansia sp. RSA 2049]|nr:hypothetical protein GGI11_003986 [Coemansia sp. RSA 2049]
MKESGESHPGHFRIEPSTRLHPQEAAPAASMLGTAAAASSHQTAGAAPPPACAVGGNLMLRVDGWYQQNQLNALPQQQQQQQQQPPQQLQLQQHRQQQQLLQKQSTDYYSSVHGRLALTDYSSPIAAGAKRPSDDADAATDALQSSSANKRSRGFRINDLLNPAVAAAVPALSAAHNMTVPTALGRTRSADSKLYYQQIAQLQLRLQQNQQHQQHQQQNQRYPGNNNDKDNNDNDDDDEGWEIV